MRQQRPMPGMWLRRVWLTFVAGLVAVGLGAGPARAATNGRVLILDSTVFDGPTSTEAQAATAAGRGADVVSPAQWAAMSTADFASYDALVLGDPDCGSFTPAPIAVPTANAAVWSPAVHGDVVVMGVPGAGQALSHSTAGPLVRNSIAYAVARPGATGLFVSLSCYYVAAPPGTPVPLLDRLSSSGTFAVEGRSDVTACLDTVHIVAPAHPVLAGLTDGDLSNWGCSTDEAFDTFPSDFAGLPLNRDLPAPYSAADGSTGGPYILARRQAPAPPACGTATSRIGTQQMQPAVDQDSDGPAEH